MRDRFAVAVTVALSTLVVLVAAAPLAGAAVVGAPADASGSSAAGVGTSASAVAGATTGGTTSLHQEGARQCAEGTASYPLQVEDNTSTTVTIEEEPETVVTLGPSAAQTMWELDAEDEVVGVTQFAAYLEGAEERTNVSTPQFGSYDTEAIVSLDPDVVLAPNVVFDDSVSTLRDAGITVYKFDPATSIKDIQQKTLLTGALVGECEAARETNRWVSENLDAASEAVGDRESVRALYVSFGQTTGAGTFTHSMIGASGATNVVSEAGEEGYIFPVNEELVVQQDPEWLVVTPGTDTARAPYNQTTAVEEGNVVVVDNNWLNQPAPRSVVFAVRNMTEAFHGDAYGPENYVSRSEATRTPTPTSTTTTGTTTDTTADETTAATTGPDDGQSQPGLGAVVAVVALLGALALLRRRD